MHYKRLLPVLVLVLLVLTAQVGLAQTPVFDSGAACAAETPCPDPVAGNAQVSAAAGAVAAEVLAQDEAAPASEGFWLAWAVMAVLVLAMVYALVAAIMAALGNVPPAIRGSLTLAIPILSVIGLGVAVYLTVVETANVEPVCGPVGDCGAVQASPFAKLFGFLPVGGLGAAGYVLILVAWAVQRFTSGTLARLAPLAIFAMALFGVVFSIYLTYLELFVIRAVCIWCVTSAFIMSFVLMLSVGSAVDALLGEE